MQDIPFKGRPISSWRHSTNRFITTEQEHLCLHCCSEVEIISSQDYWQMAQWMKAATLVSLSCFYSKESCFSTMPAHNQRWLNYWIVTIKISTEGSRQRTLFLNDNLDRSVLGRRLSSEDSRQWLYVFMSGYCSSWIDTFLISLATEANANGRWRDHEEKWIKLESDFECTLVGNVFFFWNFLIGMVPVPDPRPGIKTFMVGFEIGPHRRLGYKRKLDSELSFSWKNRVVETEFVDICCYQSIMYEPHSHLKRHQRFEIKNAVIQAVHVAFLECMCKGV